MKNNNVKVKVQFTSEMDENLALYTLNAKIRYALPSVFGFKKYKELNVSFLENLTLEDWLKSLKTELKKNVVKSKIHSIVAGDIMNRVQDKQKQEEPEIINQVLNMLNQLKFDFNFDVEEAEEINCDIQKVLNNKPNNPFGSVQGDYFNFNSGNGGR